MSSNPPSTFGFSEQERLDVPAVPREVVELLLVEAAGDRPLSRVMLLMASRRP